MNEKDLYTGIVYGNGNLTYYVDEKCSIPYTGHVEVIYNGILEEEFNVVDGLRNGIEKQYENGNLTWISETKGNRCFGFGVEYYPSVAFKTIAIWWDDDWVLAYSYSEDGQNVEKSEMSERTKQLAYAITPNPDNFFETVSMEAFEKMNKEIIKYGHPLNPPNGFEFVSMDN